MKIFEDRTSAVISPTNHQKQVLTKIIAAATPQLAATEVSKGRQLVAARDMLIKLGLIKIDDNKAEVTDLGKEVMTNQNLIDNMGSLTPEGEKIAFGDKPQTESLIRSINQQICS